MEQLALPKTQIEYVNFRFLQCFAENYFKNGSFCALNVSEETFFQSFSDYDFQVSTMLCRDLDSRIIPREAKAVYEWLESDQSLHVMRDHPSHDFEIVGCCWGMKLTKKDREMVAAAFHNGATDQSLWAYKDKYLPDQNFLRRYVNIILVNRRYPEVPDEA